MNARYVKFARRVGISVVILALSVYGASYNARWLLAQYYDRFVNSHLRAGTWVPQIPAAADWNIRLTPFAADPYILNASVMLRMGDANRALSEHREALTYGVNDPFIWQSFAHFKSGLGQLDEEFTHAQEQVRLIAPTNYSLRIEGALLGLNYWTNGTAAQRAFWADDVRFVLRVDPGSYLRTVAAQNQDVVFCELFQAEAAYLPLWCDSIRHAKQVCHLPNIRPKVQRKCWQLGLRPKPTGR